MRLCLLMVVVLRNGRYDHHLWIPKRHLNTNIYWFTTIWVLEFLCTLAGSPDEWNDGVCFLCVEEPGRSDHPTTTNQHWIWSNKTKWWMPDTNLRVDQCDLVTLKHVRGPKTWAFRRHNPGLSINRYHHGQSHPNKKPPESQHSPYLSLKSCAGVEDVRCHGRLKASCYWIDGLCGEDDLLDARGSRCRMALPIYSEWPLKFKVYTLIPGHTPLKAYQPLKWTTHDYPGIDEMEGHGLSRWRVAYEPLKRKAHNGLEWMMVKLIVVIMFEWLSWIISNHRLQILEWLVIMIVDKRKTTWLITMATIIGNYQPYLITTTVNSRTMVNNYVCQWLLIVMTGC